MASAYDPNARYEIDIKDVEYRRVGNEPMLARICQPVGEGPFPVLLSIHGGAWTGNDRTGNNWWHEPLASSGITICSLDFRLGPQHPYPASIQDINLGTRWIKAHAAEFKGDPATIGGIGYSSGGHQVTLSAMRPRDPMFAIDPLAEGPEIDASLRYVIACWPILDPYGRYLYAQDAAREGLVNSSEAYFGSVDAMHEGNPQEMLDRGAAIEMPPMLIIQGTADDNVPYEMQERFTASYEGRGGSCELQLFPGMRHRGEWPQEEVDRGLTSVREFVARQLESSRSQP